MDLGGFLLMLGIVWALACLGIWWWDSQQPLPPIPPRTPPRETPPVSTGPFTITPKKYLPPYQQDWGHRQEYHYWAPLSDEEALARAFQDEQLAQERREREAKIPSRSIWERRRDQSS